MFRLISGVLIIVGVSLVQAATVVVVDSIPDVNRSYFNGFESNPCPNTAACPLMYSEDNIQVEQISGDVNDIWLKYFTPEGVLGWYPNGGDNGYTKITLVDGAPILDFGLLRGSGNSSFNVLVFELWNNGVMVQTGTVPHTHDVAGTYLGFMGGGFDEVRLRDGLNIVDFSDSSVNALAIDAIELITGTGAPTFGPATPIPGLSFFSMMLLASLMGILGLRRRRNIQI